MGRRFRRGALIVLVLIVLLVSVLATVVGSVIAGSPPAPWVTVLVAAAVVVGLLAIARLLWRNAHAIGTLMDAADRVADGDYATRVPEAGPRQLGRLTGAFNEMTGRLQTDEERRRELLADIAHELRTPLQVIRGKVEGMLDGLYPTEPEQLRPLIDATDTMARLLDDLRTLSMAKAGALPLHREPVDPGALARDVVDGFAPLAGRAGVAIEVTVSPGLTAPLDADPTRLTEILTNLVANAVDHTPPGGRVVVRVDVDGGDAASFEVADTGSGIAADRLPFVFDRFVTSSDTGGTGLGLAIAKRLVEAHGGTIEASSSGFGTTIRFVIPLR